MFLDDIPLAQARARFDALLAPLWRGARRTERIPRDAALGRIAAQTAFARLSSPHYHACAMDGFAVRSAATHGAREAAAVTLRIGVDAFEVDTGDPLPEDCDAVVMLEDVQRRGDELVVRAATAPFAHVRSIGEDLVATEAVIAAYRELSAYDLAALAAAGLGSVEVIARPRVAIVTTGDELVDPSTDAPPRGAILDSNAVLLVALVRTYGGEPTLIARVPDERAQLLATLQSAIAQHDAVIVNAGSSAGRDDYTASIFAEAGRVVVHGVAIRPGHPLVLGAAHDGTPLLGIPGYPVSAAICADLFVKPLVERLAGRLALPAETIDVELTRKVYSPLGDDEFVRVAVARVGGRLVAAPLQRGAGVITSLSRANAIVCSPRFSEGFARGARVPAQLLRSRAAIERTILAIGSHDVAIDLLAAALAERGCDLVSANVGSIAGLVSLREGGAHLAGTHAIDPLDGSYNDRAVREFGPQEPVALVHFAYREQGLIVAPGNPLALHTLADLVLKKARFVNRQRDAGTRMLLDLMLARADFEPTELIGYERIEFTHLAAAALVADGAADAALGIRAAAVALGCDFVPLTREPYELAVLERERASPHLAWVFDALADPALQAAIDARPGYDARDIGRVRVVAP